MFHQLHSIGKTLFLMFALAGLATFALAQAEAVKFPDTPAGLTASNLA